MSLEDLPEDPSLAGPLPKSPFEILARWRSEAWEQKATRNPGAMGLATVAADGRPSLRIVMCRGFVPEPGYVVFYTDRESRKGRELASQPFAAAAFHYDAQQRLARIEGPIVASPAAESDGWFKARPRPLQVAAWASAQSRPLVSREALLEQLAAAEARFGGPDGPPIPRPPHWGGYRLWAERVDLWVGSEGPAHDRALWRRELEPSSGGFETGEWRSERLQP